MEIWTVEGEEPPAKEAKPAAKKGGSKKRSARWTSSKLIYVMPDQTGVPEGMARFWCNACQDASRSRSSARTPAGADDPELTAPAGVTAEDASE